MSSATIDIDASGGPQFLWPFVAPTIRLTGTRSLTKERVQNRWATPGISAGARGASH